MNTNATSSRPVPPTELFSGLEPRQLMANFASVGIEFAPTDTNLNAAMYAVEGAFTSGGAASGDMYFATVNGRQKVTGLPYSSITKLADGRYQRSPNRGYRGEPIESNGAQFLTADRFAAGWWFGQYSSNSNDVEFIVERATNATLSDLAGSWRFGMITANTNTGHYINGTGVLTFSSALASWTVADGDIPYNTSLIATTDSDGRFVSSAKEYFYLSADKKTLLFVDMNRADGIIYVGAAVRIDTSVNSQTMSGKGYLLAWLWSQTNGANFSTQASARQTYLDLESDGDYKIYDLDLWDDGKRDTYLEKGFWSVSNGILTLDQDKSEDYTKFVISNGGANVLLITEGPTNDPDATMGFGTRAVVTPPPPTSPQHYLTVSALDSGGRPVVYELGVDGVWRVTDLLTKPGGPQLLSTPVSWLDQKDFKLYAAGISDIGLIIYTQGYDGTWTFRNVSVENTGSQFIKSALQVMVAPDKLATITGLDATGNVLRYYQDGTKVGSTSDYTFKFANISTGDLASQGLTTPAFSGKLVSYATSWGGLNIAGLDSNGDIWSVWWAPGLAKWTVSNLTTITGATKLTGGLTVYLTSWSGINIAGLDADGHLQVTWWVPSFGGDWEQSDLSSMTTGGTAVKFRASTVTSYVSSWDGLNIAGIDDNTGKLTVFWWSPARVNDGWAITNLSDTVPGGSPAIVRDTTGSAGLDGSLNVFGYTSTNQFVRYFWVPSGSWTVLNLTTTATPR